MEIFKSFSPDKYEVHFKVEEEENAKRLDQFIQGFLQSFSRQQVKKKIISGDIQIVGRPFPHKPSTKIYHNEIIQLVTHNKGHEDEYWKNRKLVIENPKVLFEDEGLLVASKPPFMATHPTGRHLFNCATVYFEHILKSTVHSIHRLDRETSGVLFLGKTPATAQKISFLFEEDKVQKCYFLMAHKSSKAPLPLVAKERLGTEADFIPRLFTHCYPQNSSQGKHAQTSFHKIFENEKYVLCLAFPKTGRQHQIRAHAAFHGLPLIGDKIYNGDPAVFMRFKDKVPSEEDYELMQISRHALHALAAKLTYQGEERTFRSPLPQDFKDWLSDQFKENSIDEIENKIDQLLKNFL